MNLKYSNLIGQRFPNFFDRGPVREFKIFLGPPFGTIPSDYPM